jgi:hypothetical protein
VSVIHKKRHLLIIFGMAAVVLLLTLGYTVVGNAEASPEVTESKTLPKSLIGHWYFYDRARDKFSQLAVTKHSVKIGKQRVAGKNLTVDKIHMANHYQYSFTDKRHQNACFAVYHPAKAKVAGKNHRAILMNGRYVYLPFKTTATAVASKADRY